MALARQRLAEHGGVRGYGQALTSPFDDVVVAPISLLHRAGRPAAVIWAVAPVDIDAVELDLAGHRFGRFAADMKASFAQHSEAPSTLSCEFE